MTLTHMWQVTVLSLAPLVPRCDHTAGTGWGVTGDNNLRRGGVEEQRNQEGGSRGLRYPGDRSEV